ncbi:MAG: 6-carboxytetrahydropterin synthase [Gemmatimonadaceae bacterium]
MFLLSRRVAFSASHHYSRPEWSDERNARAFGSALRPHAHNYTCYVTVAGEIDPVTGMVADLAALDRVLEDEVRQRFDGRDINRDVVEFADGGLVPTGENLARFILELVQRKLGAAVLVSSVTVREDEALSVEYRA